MVRYFFEDIEYKYTGRRFNNAWLRRVAQQEQCRLGEDNIIFCSDTYLLNINLQYLGHDYYTDIITFDYFDEELHRVIVHGLLHLIGYDDHTEADQAEMRSMENKSLELRRRMSE